MHRMKPWNDNVQFQRRFLFAELKEWEASKSLNKATSVTTNVVWKSSFCMSWLFQAI